jgi:hypothetical protein
VPWLAAGVSRGSPNFKEMTWQAPANSAARVACGPTISLTTLVEEQRQEVDGMANDSAAAPGDR